MCRIVDRRDHSFRRSICLTIGILSNLNELWFHRTVQAIYLSYASCHCQGEMTDSGLEACDNLDWRAFGKSVAGDHPQ